MQLIV